jgi:HEAT repeat protein
MPKYLTALLICLQCSLFCSPKSDILFKARMGNLKEACNLYFEYKIKIGKDDLEIIEKMAFIILDQGYRSKDPKEQFSAVFGAGVSKSPRLTYILEEGLNHENPQIQLASLVFLSELTDDSADDLIKKAMNSGFLPIRFEAAKILATKKCLDATDRVEGLMYQTPIELHPFFPSLFAISSNSHSTSLLKKCFISKNSTLRIASVLAAIDFNRDDLLPQIRTLAVCGNVEEQEAAAFALGALQDREQINLLQNLSKSSYSNVRLAALISLYKLGDLSAKDSIFTMAKAENLFAITALGDISGCEDDLYEMTKNSKAQVKVNAAIALLKRRDERCLNLVLEMLIRGSKDIAIVEDLSPGFTLQSWKAVSCSSHKFAPDSMEAEMILSVKEGIINAAIDLPKETFYKFAKALLDAKDPELVPALITNLEAIKSEETIAFLKKELQRAGAPLVRAYCNLSLFRLHEEGPYHEYVKMWVRDLKNVDMINFKPLQPRQRGLTTYKMTPEETCRLFVESATALASEKDPQSLEALLIALTQGNPLNRFALAGLVLRAIE